MLLIARIPSRALAATLAGLLALPSLPAQEAPKGKLHIEIIEGEGATNNIRQRLAREPIVEVQDENRKPLAGATVVFLLPESGASGVFPNGARMLTVTTDANGRAVATGLRPNSVPGKFQIRVSANSQGMTGSAIITQTNVLVGAAAGAAAGGVSAKVIGILVGVGAAAAGGAVIATRSSGGESPQIPPQQRRTVSISAGAPNVGPPPR